MVREEVRESELYVLLKSWTYNELPSEEGETTPDCGVPTDEPSKYAVNKPPFSHVIARWCHCPEVQDSDPDPSIALQVPEPQILYTR